MLVEQRAHGAVQVRPLHLHAPARACALKTNIRAMVSAETRDESHRERVAYAFSGRCTADSSARTRCVPVLRGAPVASALMNSDGAVRRRDWRRYAVCDNLRSGSARREGAARVRTGAFLPLASAFALFCQLTHVAPPQLLTCRTCMLCSCVVAVGPTCTTRRCGACVLRSALRRVPSRAIGCWGATGHRGGERRRVRRECLYHAVLRWHVELNVSVCACAPGRRRSAAPGANAPRAAIECMLPGCAA